MRFLIVNSDYPAFLDSLYAEHPGLAGRPYVEQLQARCDTLFGTADFYPKNLQALGHEAAEFHANNKPLQLAWADEHGLNISADPQWRLTVRRGVIPWLKRDRDRWMDDVLAAQIEDYRPDVILTHAVNEFDAQFWRVLKDKSRLLIGQIASPLSSQAELGHFDVMLSSLPNFVERFRQAGLPAERFQLAFDPAVLDKLGQPKQTVDVSFVGSLSVEHHRERIDWLEFLCRETDVHVWGTGVEALPPGSSIRNAYQGTAWGIDMYRVLARTRVTLNHHIGLAGPFANNMRLYEASGVGTLLLTDWKRNLSDILEPERDVAVYRNRAECLSSIRYYLENEADRSRIAAAGQQRTLRDHTYRQRMQQLVTIVERHL